MFRIKPAIRIALTIGVISAMLVWIAVGMQLVPDPNASRQEKRIAIIKTLAASTTGLAMESRLTNLKRSLLLVTELNPDIQSAGVRGRRGYLAQSKDHEARWGTGKSGSHLNQCELEILASGKKWGTLEVRFNETHPAGLLGFMFPFNLIMFVSATTTLFSWFVLKKSFRYLNPSKVVPKRVRSAFDTLAEGLVLIDRKFEVAHANQAFGEILGVAPESLIGKSINEMGWKTDGGNSDPTMLPWLECIATEKSIIGQILELGEGETRRKFIVNSAPVRGDRSECRGVMISLDDVTQMEEKTTKLAELITSLRSSRDEVKRQNEQLTFLASYDPLTQCMNRRAFWIEFEKLWASVESSELSLLIIDVDHFKSFNDTYGHSFGDRVLKELGATLRNIVSDKGVVCRYGGEEFLTAIPNLSIDDALQLTNEIHAAIQEMDLDGKTVTASIGFSNGQFKAMDGQHMLDQADLCLYSAKRNGRNQIVRFDQCDNQSPEQAGAEADQERTEEIPYAAVSGLLSALAFRCQATADHSTRVSDLCVQLGTKLLNRRDLYRLEIAALLHDIGKIGVPDSILHKADALTEDDWKIMKQHDEIGLQIVRSAFSSSPVSEVIEAHQSAVKSPGNAGESLENSTQISAALIKLCDAFDSMRHDSVYRKAMSVEEALKEIVSHTPDQFDEQMVQRLIDHVNHFQDEQSQSNGEADRDTEFANKSTIKAEVAEVDQYIEKMDTAVQNQDVEELKTVANEANEVRSDAFPTEKDSLADTAEKLSALIDDGSIAEMDEAFQLAGEVIGLCDQTRQSVQSNSDAESASEAVETLD